MKTKLSNYLKVKKEYLKFIKSQEILGEPFRDKIEQLKRFYIPLSEMIYKNFKKKKKIRIIGLSGGQGSGKSTISNILKIILKLEFNLNTIFFSIDDFYKTQKARRKLSKKTSELFLTRGVPGTHDTKLLLSCLKKLKKKRFKKFMVPRFDKSNDERFPKKNWIRVSQKPDIVIFEGWCVGATPQKKRDLLHPVNELERLRDKNLKWRNMVNQELEDKYKKIFNHIDDLIFLKVPSFKHVCKWRLLQEKKLRVRSKGKKTMSDSQIKNFVMFYERITNHMLKTLQQKPKSVISIDDKHRLKSIKFN